MQTDPALDVKLVQHARESQWLEGAAPSLMRMPWRGDLRIKSKVAFLIGRVNKDALLGGNVSG